MKVFISHSAVDRWVARRISQDLQALGIETFLDEKDIVTGDSIDSSIQQHLRDSDEVLILLSPTAINSTWVLVELGGAIALDKRVIPILQHVGANEIPNPISKALARDINEIDKYYKEAQERLQKPTKARRSSVKRPTSQRPRRYTINFKVGEKVKIPDTRQPAVERDPGPSIDWNPSMDTYRGMEATITQVDSDQSVKLDVDGGNFWWAFEWLQHLSVHE